MNKNILWKFKWDCGSMGKLESLFIASKNEVEQAIGKEVYFGEVLGKHSEVCGTLDKEDLTEADANDTMIEELLDLFGENVCGYNPLEFIEDDAK
jgi:hypothetical protein